MRREFMRVLHNFPIWLPQTQTWMYNQIKFLPDSVRVDIICERTENLDQFNLPNIHSLRDASLPRYFLERAFRKLLFRRGLKFLTSAVGEFKADIVHSHFGDIGWAYSSAVGTTKAKHIVTFYGYDVNMLPSQDKRWLKRYRELFEQADLFLFEGPHMAEQLLLLGCPPQKARVHHLGIDMAAVPYRPRTWAKGEPLRVLIAAAFREKKGIPYALEALARLGRFWPLEITIIGDANSTRRSLDEKNRILATLEKNGQKSITRLLGYQPYPILFAEAYRHHVFLSPSITARDGDTEGGAPVSLIDMLATGMPVVSTNHCDIPEVVQYGIEDWLVGERDVDGLVARMEWLMENPGEWRAMLDIGRRHVEHEFNAMIQGERLEQIYRDVLDRQVDR